MLSHTCEVFYLFFAVLKFIQRLKNINGALRERMFFLLHVGGKQEEKEKFLKRTIKLLHETGERKAIYTIPAISKNISGKFHKESTLKQTQQKVEEEEEK